jgi:hypothetical protein
MVLQLTNEKCPVANSSEFWRMSNHGVFEVFYLHLPRVADLICWTRLKPLDFSMCRSPKQHTVLIVHLRCIVSQRFLSQSKWAC